MARALQLLAVAALACASALDAEPLPAATPPPPTTAHLLLLRELAVTDALIAALQARVGVLRSLLAAGDVSVEALQAALAGNASLEAASLAGAPPAPGAAARAAPPPATAVAFDRYLVAKRTLQAPQWQPVAAPAAAAAPSSSSSLPPAPSPAPPLVALLLVPLARMGGAAPRGARVAPRPAPPPAGRQHRRDSAAAAPPPLRAPARLIVRVHADGSVRFDTDVEGSGVVACTGGGGECAAHDEGGGTHHVWRDRLLPPPDEGGGGGGSDDGGTGSHRSHSWWAPPGGGCALVAAAYGRLPEGALLLSDACGRVHVVGVGVKHNGGLLLGRRLPGGGGGSGRGGGGGGGDGPMVWQPGTEVRLHHQCTITLPLRGAAATATAARRGSAAEATAMAATVEEAAIGADGGAVRVAAEDARAHPPASSSSSSSSARIGPHAHAPRDVGVSLAAFDSGINSDAGNLVLVGTSPSSSSSSGALLAYFRNCSWAGELYAGSAPPLHGRDLLHGSPPPPLHAPLPLPPSGATTAGHAPPLPPPLADPIAPAAPAVVASRNRRPITTVAALARQGSIVAFAAGQHIRFLSVTRRGLTQHACELGGGGPSDSDDAVTPRTTTRGATVLAYDALFPSVLWAGTADGALLAFNTRAGGVAAVAGDGRPASGVACHLLVRLPPAQPAAAAVAGAQPPPPQPLSARACCLAATVATTLTLAPLRGGYLAVASGAGGVVVYNTSAVLAGRVDVVATHALHHAHPPGGAGTAAAADGGSAAAAFDEDAGTSSHCAVPCHSSHTAPSSSEGEWGELPPAVALPVQWAVSDPRPEGGPPAVAAGSRRRWHAGGLPTDAVLLLDTSPPVHASPHVAAAAVGAVYDVLLPPGGPRAGGGAGSSFTDYAAWGSLGLLVGLVGALRIPLTLLGVAGVVWHQTATAAAARGRRQLAWEDGGDGEGEDDDELPRRSGGGGGSAVRRALGAVAQGASLLLLRGPLGVAARIGLEQTRQASRSLGSGAQRGATQHARGSGGGGDSGSGGRGGGDDDEERQLERLIARMAARSRMERQLRAQDHPSARQGSRGGGGGGEEAGGGGLDDRDEDEVDDDEGELGAAGDEGVGDDSEVEDDRGARHRGGGSGTGALPSQQHAALRRRLLQRHLLRPQQQRGAAFDDEEDDDGVLQIPGGGRTSNPYRDGSDGSGSSLDGDGDGGGDGGDAERLFGHQREVDEAEGAEGRWEGDEGDDDAGAPPDRATHRVYGDPAPRGGARPPAEAPCELAEAWAAKGEAQDDDGLSVGGEPRAGDALLSTALRWADLARS